MTSRPRLETNSRQVVGLVALALFGVLSAVFLTADFSGTFTDPGFGGAPITPSIGYALFDLPGGEVPSEGFLVAFEIIDVVLVAALVAAVMLARREETPLSFGPRRGDAGGGEAASAQPDGGETGSARPDGAETGSAQPDGGSQNSGADESGGDR